MQHKEGPPLPLTQPRDRAGRFVDQDETVFSAFLPHIKLMIVIFAAVSGFMSPFLVIFMFPPWILLAKN